MIRRILLVLLLAGVAAAVAWTAFAVLPHRRGPARRPATLSAAAAPAPAAEPARRIKARLFYVSEDGARLTAVEREVPYAEGPVAQARAIVEAQIAPAAEPDISAIPPGTKLRALFITDRGDAYVDLSREVAAAHPGGSGDEVLTVYSIVDALTTNLPAVAAVQILVEGREVDTLAGHVDLRRPLAKNLDWVMQ